MIKLNIGSDDEFNEIQTALQYYLAAEIEELKRSDSPETRGMEMQHIASIKIINSLLSRLAGLENLRRKGRRDENC